MSQNLSGLLPHLQAHPDFLSLTQSVAAGASDIAISVPEPARPYLLAAMAATWERPLLVLTPFSDRARRLADALQQWVDPATHAYLFAEPDAGPYERLPWSLETRQQRLRVLFALHERRAKQRPLIIVTSLAALRQKSIPPSILARQMRVLRLGQEINTEKFLLYLQNSGYEGVSLVERPGQYSRRGGVLDLYPPHLTWPVRIDLFGDEIDTLRLFDPSTQRTLANRDFAYRQQIVVGPANELLPAQASSACSRLQEIDVGSCYAALQQQMTAEIGALCEGIVPRNAEFYLPYVYEQPATLLDHLPSTTILLWEDSGAWQHVAADLHHHAEQTRTELLAERELPANAIPPYVSADAIAAQIAPRRTLHFAATSDEENNVAINLHRTFTGLPHFGGQTKPFVAAVAELHAGEESVVIASREALLLRDLLVRRDLPISTEETDRPLLPGEIRLQKAVIAAGWALNLPGDRAGHKLWLFSDAEIFGWRKPARRRYKVKAVSGSAAFFSDVKPGDYVVHIEHGIGLYHGLERATVDGIEREYIKLIYAQGDTLLVPVQQADRLARYVGPGQAQLQLHRLGTTDWENAKQKARRAIADIAQELLALYAARATTPGHAFSPDTPWQMELEAAFPYADTPDQRSAMQEVKQDMEKPKPMDRLICGDVGYGKTEIAVRAAFKAIMDGKQVAVLVPTTVLAQQHFNTFARRFAPFPARVEMLSRFQTQAEQRQIISALAAGQIDIVIGTHRLLSKDVQFKDLGLLVVDEEQRFGVTHKEKLKALRTKMDVLTLSATPIPRTLHMSLSGIRDMSIINTPPQERHPIKTVVAEYDEKLVRQAMRRELDRGGQVYFVHNRVQSIDIVAEKVRRLLPTAEVAVAHGQMAERQLEKVMLAFAKGGIDVLVTTTIIENGLDIPNANTLIIDRADRFGLAQLYQLRGRVGRGIQRAYAYLLYPHSLVLSEIARRRLQVIQEASELGAGFRVAMMDLELRGAGDILGARQSGHIAAIGFDLYAKLLAQAVETVQRNGTEALRAMAEQAKRSGNGNGHQPTLLPSLTDVLSPPVTLDLPLPSRLPASLVPDDTLRLRMYRRIADLNSLADVEAMELEIQDRFGELPQPLQNLLYQIRIKILAKSAGVESIVQNKQQMVLHARWLGRADRQALQRLLGPAVRVGRRDIWLAVDNGWQKRLENLLRQLQGAMP